MDDPRDRDGFDSLDGSGGARRPDRSPDLDDLDTIQRPSRRPPDGPIDPSLDGATAPTDPGISLGGPPRRGQTEGPAFGELSDPPPAERHGDGGEADRRKLWWGLAIVLLIIAAGLAYLLLRPDAPEPPAAAEVVEPSEPPAPPPAPTAAPIDLPPLAETDPLVRKLVGALSSHPQVLAWLATDQLIRNFVLVTVNVAEGLSPAPQLRALAPEARFQARQSGGRFYVAAESYARYNPYADAVASLDAEGTATLYAQLTPRIDEAYAELGSPHGTFEATLERALVELLGAPVVEGEIPLEEATLAYAFADPGLESRSGAQRHLLRMGPRNMRLVQAKLREIALYLGIPRDRLPEPAFVNVGGGI